MIRRYAKPIFRTAVALLCALPAEAAPSQRGSGKPASTSGWETVRTYNNWGKHKVFFANDFFRMDDPIRDFSIVMSGPDWVVHYFSDKKKIIYSVPISRLGRSFSERMGLLSGTHDQNAEHWKMFAKGKLLGREVDQFRLVTDKHGKPLERLGYHELFTDAEINVDPRVCKMFANLYDEPDVGRVPMRALTGTAKAHVHMDTLSIKKVVVSPAMRAIPKGYKRVSNAETVMFEDPSFF